MSGDLKVWEERRSKVGTVLEEHHPPVHCVLDLGCGDGKLFQLMKFNPQFTELCGIDSDAKEVGNAESRVGPEMHHIFEPAEPSTPPLTIRMYEGDITRPSKKIKRDWDAITLVEVIEHLHQPELEALPQVLFSYYRSRLVIITTPNQDYNSCIRGFKGSNYGGFRHPDHKFEWTRAEFKKWAHRQCRRYGYRVRFETVGRVNPKDEEDFWELETHGRCTQIAVFEPLSTRQNLEIENKSPNVAGDPISSTSGSPRASSPEEGNRHDTSSPSRSQSASIDKEDSDSDTEPPPLKFGTMRQVVHVTFPRQTTKTKRRRRRMKRYYYRN